MCERRQKPGSEKTFPDESPPIFGINSIEEAPYITLDNEPPISEKLEKFLNLASQRQDLNPPLFQPTQEEIIQNALEAIEDRKKPYIR